MSASRVYYDYMYSENNYSQAIMGHSSTSSFRAREYNQEPSARPNRLTSVRRSKVDARARKKGMLRSVAVVTWSKI